VQNLKNLVFGRHEIVISQACVSVMALWKLRVGVEAYYLSQVASGLDEYYTGAGEAPGNWMGGGVAGLGLTGEVSPADLRAALAGLSPNTGSTPNGTTLTTHPRRVPGFDLTFSVPKSVSVLYALGDPLVQHAVTEACETALAEALGWLEREACFVRRGTNKAENKQTWGEAWGTRRMVAAGFVAASFRHRTSRAGDPHLHWHVLVANMAQGIDGRWTSLDGTALFAAKRTVGVMFQAVMRRELTEQLGLSWGPVRKDSAEVAGIPARVLGEFSQRSTQIAEWLHTAGRSGPVATDEAILATRARKQTPADWTVVEAGWRARADGLGWGAIELEQLLAATTPATDPVRGFVVDDVVWSAGESTVVPRVVEFEEWLEWLLETRVTANAGTFTRFDLTQAIASALHGTSITTIESLVQRALASSAIVSIGDHQTEQTSIQAHGRVVPDDRQLRYTSRALLGVERRLLDQLAGGADAGCGVLDRVLVETAITASTLGDDQANAIRVLTAGGDRVAVMVGRAGTGKTHTLGTLHTAYQAVGYTVLGLAPSARAAGELEAGSGISSTTIARHLVKQREIDATTVVIIDEAGMAAVRDIAAIIDQATRVGAKVVLVGDHHQLPEVGAGGAFRAALDVLGARVVELSVNRRQHHPWEQPALDQLRHGDVTTAFAAYLDHDRVVVGDNADQLHAQAISHWQQLRASGDALMLAGTRAETTLLNQLARQALADAGQLDLTRQVEIGGRTFTPGDWVVLGRNHPGQHLDNGDRFAVENGMLATIVDFHDDSVHVVLATGEHVRLDRSYVERGWVDHAYALTIHKAQGITCDHILLIGPDGLYREGIYVALSRARLTAWIYATTTQAVEIEQRHSTGIPLPTETALNPERDLLARMHLSAAKTLVTVGDPLAARVAALAATVPARELLERAGMARAAELAVNIANPSEQRDAYVCAFETRVHLEPGRRVRALDRDNVGHIEAIDDDTGSCIVHFESDRQRRTTKTIRWSDLIVIDHPDTVTLTPTAAATLVRMADDLDEAELDWKIKLSAYGVEPGDADLYRRAGHVAVDRAARQLRAETPDWLTAWIGRRPTTPAAASVWDDATTRIAHHRLLHNIADHTPGIGPRPVEPHERDHWQQLMVRTLEDRLWLVDHPTPTVLPPAAATPTELTERHQQLRQLLDTAPADQRQIIDRIGNSSLDATQIHQYLAAAVAGQDARREWIITNWPHIIELEQITRIITTQQALGHWPTEQPQPVRTVLDQLRHYAAEPVHREQRTLAELDRLEGERDPVRRLEARRDRLHQLAKRPASPAEQEAIHQQLLALHVELRQARRQRTTDQIFEQYLPDPTDDARATRIATLAADTLTNQPTWVIDHVRHLHNNHQLQGVDLAELATRLITTAAHHDLHGQLPAGWPAPPLPEVVATPPGIEIG
jgi:conjugative relaxase-like TrwC/TraI family protein